MKTTILKFVSLEMSIEEARHIKREIDGMMEELLKAGVEPITIQMRFMEVVKTWMELARLTKEVNQDLEDRVVRPASLKKNGT